jgi:putative DNA primase/helicase
VTFLQIALHCIQRGWFVFPCKPKSKEPQLYGAFHNASTDESQIRDWWSKFPNANVAIALRKSGLAVLDCDHGNVTEADFRT